MSNFCKTIDKLYNPRVGEVKVRYAGCYDWTGFFIREGQNLFTAIGFCDYEICPKDAREARFNKYLVSMTKLPKRHVYSGGGAAVTSNYMRITFNAG
jgi:hypothetical protein